MCEKCKANLLFRRALLELIGMHLLFHFAKCILQLPSLMDIEYQTLLILLAKLSYIPEPSVNTEFSVVESNVEFGENFGVKTKLCYQQNEITRKLCSIKLRIDFLKKSI